jgi:hypothetical protein
MLQRTNATTKECYNERMLKRENAATKESNNERMPQRTLSANKIIMLQRTMLKLTDFICKSKMQQQT